MDGNLFTHLTKQELVSKANQAVEQMEIQDDIHKITFIGVKKLTNGGIIYDLETQEAAWFIQNNK